ncbi:MAG: universal stress protein [Bacteroidota bacterium]
MNTILFPTDFSEAAHKAFVYALHFAKKYKAKVLTLHAYQKPDLAATAHLPLSLAAFYESIDLMEFESYKDSIPILRKQADEEGFSSMELQHVLEEGEVVETILKVAERDKVDMIIMGTTGVQGLIELMMGTYAGEVLENANCPVLAVPEASTFDGKIDRMAFMTSLGEIEKVGLQKIAEVAQLFDAELYCVNVDLAHTSALTNRMEAFKNSIQDNQAINFQVLQGTDVRKAIVDFVNANAIDLVAAVSTKRSFWEELFQYSRTKDLTYHTNIPVLSIQGHTL